MKINENLKLKVNRFGLKVKKYSPEILIGVGIVGTVVSGVIACKATLKVNDILDDSKDKIDKIKDTAANPYYGDKYSEEDAKKDLSIVYTQTAVKLVKLYAPSVVLGVASISCIVASNNILKKRNIAIAAAYAGVDKSFKEYRKRVVDKFGEEVDKQLRYNIKAEEVEEKVVDENGEEKVVKKCVNVVNPSEISGYARFFEKYTTDNEGNKIINPNWESNNEYNIMFLKAQERYANDLLRARGHLFLNEVYDMLGLPRSKAGQVVGWVYSEDNPVGDNFVDFGLYADNLAYSDFVNGYDNGILLDFNVDGNVLDLM